MLQYLAITVGKTGTAVDKYLPETKGTFTLHSLVSRDTPNQFQHPTEVHNLMTEAEVNQAVGWVVTEALGFTYKHHHYTFGGRIYRQKDGGPPGLKAAVEG